MTLRLDVVVTLLPRYPLAFISWCPLPIEHPRRNCCRPRRYAGGSEAAEIGCPAILKGLPSLSPGLAQQRLPWVRPRIAPSLKGLNQSQTQRSSNSIS